MRQIIGRFSRDTKGSIAVITALAAIPMIFLVGMGIDYGMAVDRQTRLNGYADAAALAAVTPSVMAQSAAIAKTAATNMFNGQAETLSNVSYNPSNLAVSIQSVKGQRVASVTYQAKYPTFFAKVLGMDTLALAGTSSATAGLPPNINFYLLLDDSPSMAIAATTAGIATMEKNTSSQGKCAFACHETNPATDNLGNPGGEDNYKLARNLGVTLRMDLVQQAASSLMATAKSTEATNGASYGMAIYSFDQAFNTVQKLTTNLTKAATAAGTISVMPVYANNYLTKTNNNNDTDTNYDTAMSGINSVMPNPGSGTGVAGDTPQEVMFFVTDGVEDEAVSGKRQQSVMDPAWCTTIKNRGIRIAVIYTIYQQIPNNSWYMTYINPIQNNIGPALETCASPGMYYAVDVDGDISAALNSLFQYAVQSAYLSR